MPMKTSVVKYPGGAQYASTASLQPQQAYQVGSGVQVQTGSHVESLERQLSEFRSALVQTQDRSAAIVQERDQRLSMQDRLVEELHQAIDSMRREAEELRRQQTELLFTNQEQARRLADLEGLLLEMQREPENMQQQQQQPRGAQPLTDHYSDRGGQQQRGQQNGSGQRSAPAGRSPRARPNDRQNDRGASGSSADVAAANSSMALLPVEARVEAQHDHHALGGDRIDLALQEFFYMHPDYDIGITKHKPGWYTFDQPIKKKVYMKIVRDSVIVKCGGGNMELHKWLLQYKNRARKEP